MAGFASPDSAINLPLMPRILLAWAIFLPGLLGLLWLHTFRDALAHSTILPLFLLFWIAFAVYVWDGCKLMAPRFRFLLFALHLGASMLMGGWFFLHLLSSV